MLFTSFTFIFFFIGIFILYWLILNKNTKGQNLLLLAGSYLFYGWWDWKFLLMLIALSVFNYVAARQISRVSLKSIRKFIFIAGLTVNIGTLFLFKYLNFFIEGLTSIFISVGYTSGIHSFDILLPIGISFYVFLSISFLIDVYKNRLTPPGFVPELLLSLVFFPIILAGPIQRPISLLPQIQTARVFKYEKMVEGLRQVLWGFVMKVLIADNVAVSANDVFDQHYLYSGSTLFIGILLFTIQIYADFAGYSHMAIGFGKLLGFDLMQNFAYPYFSRDIKTFWKRWNISLTTWFRDYVFLPTAYSLSRRLKNDSYGFIKTDFIIYLCGLMVTWMLTGLWHGANITFVVWGVLQGVLLMGNRLISKPRSRIQRKIGIGRDNPVIVFIDTIVTLLLIMISWVFFRADSLSVAQSYLSGVFSLSLFSPPDFLATTGSVILLSGTGLFFIAEWMGRNKEFPLSRLELHLPFFVRWALYFILVLCIYYNMDSQNQFLYFQF